MRFVRFNITGALGIGVQLAVLWALVHLAGVNELVATAIAVTAAVVHNFVWHWRWTWADRGLGWAQVPAAFVRFAAANGAVSLAGNVALMAVLVRGAGMPVLGANLIAIAACGLVNYGLGDRFVFKQISDSRVQIPAVRHCRR